MPQQLRSADFCFDDHKVSFIGSKVRVYELSGASPRLIREIENPWASKVRKLPNDFRSRVMGRAFTPRTSDAVKILAKVLKEAGKVVR